MTMLPETRMDLVQEDRICCLFHAGEAWCYIIRNELLENAPYDTAPAVPDAGESIHQDP